MKRRTVMANLAALATSLSGCGSPAITEKLLWKLRVIDIEERSIDGTIAAEVTVGLNGNYPADAQVESVRVCFLDAQNETMGTESIGTITTDRRKATVTVTLPRKPDVIALAHGVVDGEGEYSVQGLRRQDAGTYTVFTQGREYC